MSPDIVAKLKEMVSRLDVRSLSHNEAFRCTVADAESRYRFRVLQVFSYLRRIEVLVDDDCSRYYPPYYDNVEKAIFIRIVVADGVIMDIVLVCPVTVE